MNRMRYEVEVTGHHPPYRWVAFRAGATVTGRYQVESGLSDTFEQALEDAKRAALKAEDERLHSKTKSPAITLFEVDPTDPDGRIIDPEVRELESWLDLEDPVTEPVHDPPVHATHDDVEFVD